MLSAELTDQPEGFISNIKSICALLFTHLLRLSGADISGIYSPDGLRYYDFDRHALDQYLYKHAFDSSANIGDLAEIMNISERQVNNIINKKFGLTFTEKINEIRMEYAAVLLASTNKPIEQILGECGFKNYNYFSKCFKARFGTTPSKYRAASKL
jgi:AraC-like DNA-binding protein